jgi:hypothetical protein
MAVPLTCTGVVTCLPTAAGCAKELRETDAKCQENPGSGCRESTPACPTC